MQPSFLYCTTLFEDVSSVADLVLVDTDFNLAFVIGSKNISFVSNVQIFSLNVSFNFSPTFCAHKTS